jgi:hypothetical protein
MSSKNLWGDLKELEIIRSPKSILQEQADYLTKATEGVLMGKVDEDVRRSTFSYDLDVVVPSLNDYAYTLLTILHPLEFYPVQIKAGKPPTDITCPSEEAFERAIGTILSSPEVRKVLSRLVSQAQ